MTTPLALPRHDGDWIGFLEGFVGSRLDLARKALADLRSGVGDVLLRWNDADVALQHAISLPELLAECHPEHAVRDRATALANGAKTLRTDRDQDAGLYGIVAGVDPATLRSDAAYVRERVLGDFRAEGAHLGSGARAELAAVSSRIAELSTAFAENIRESQPSIRVAPESLAGLPQDYIDEHPVDAEGLVTITTDFPDRTPFLEMARDGAARRALVIADSNEAYPENDAVLRDLLAARHRKAELLGLATFADVATQRMMMPDGDAIGRFLDEVNDAARPAALRDIERLLERRLLDEPTATAITTADSLYYIERIKAEDLGVDANEVRRYFAFDKVRDGILALTGELFGLSFARVADAPRWHDDVEVFEVTEDGVLTGRAYLDMHPRAGKYSHMACYSLVTGIVDTTLAESVLLCNFPRGRGLLTFDDVLTFLHEFGHLIHELVSGKQTWARCSGLIEQQEWDFVEAPSQMLEEWGWQAEVLQRFATDEAGTPIPATLVDAMRASRDFCEGLFTARQVNYAQLSYRLHRDHPEDIEALANAIEREYDVRTPVAGMHMYAGFGHLTDYSACYYTYQWSLSIAKDLFTAFDPADLLNTETAMRYRREVLEPGNSRPAAESIAAFLGRPYSTAAYRSWLASL